MTLDLVVCNRFLSFSRIELSEFIHLLYATKSWAFSSRATRENCRMHPLSWGKIIKMTWTNGEGVKESSNIVFVIVCFKRLKVWKNSTCDSDGSPVFIQRFYITSIGESYHGHFVTQHGRWAQHYHCYVVSYTTGRVSCLYVCLRVCACVRLCVCYERCEKGLFKAVSRLVVMIVLKLMRDIDKVYCQCVHWLLIIESACVDNDYWLTHVSEI